MIKHKNLCSYNFSMATKDLTRDEAREAIGILAIRVDNVENATIVTLGVLFTMISILDIKYNVVSYLIGIEAILLIALGCVLVRRFKKIDEKAKKLAKEHNLKEFYNAVLGKESVRELVNKIIKKLSM